VHLNPVGQFPTGFFDWSKISEEEVRALSEKMFEAAKVPLEIRTKYWEEFERMRVLDAAQMQRFYGSFCTESPRIQLNRDNVPPPCLLLLPYAEFWGVADDWKREGLVSAAPLEVRQNLKSAVAEFDEPLDDWLAGPDADAAQLSAEYVAFTALRMAADSA
jgi:hypothetical protein